MAMLGVMKRLWRHEYRILTIWGILVLLPSILVIFPSLLLLAVVEFFVLDIPWLILTIIEEGFARLKSNVWYLMHF